MKTVIIRTNKYSVNVTLHICYYIQVHILINSSALPCIIDSYFTNTNKQNTVRIKMFIARTYT